MGLEQSKLFDKPAAVAFHLDPFIVFQYTQ